MIYTNLELKPRILKNLNLIFQLHLKNINENDFNFKFNKPLTPNMNWELRTKQKFRDWCFTS